MRKPIRAYGGNGRSAIYEFADGTGEVRKGKPLAEKPWFPDSNRYDLIKPKFFLLPPGLAG